MLDVHVFRFEGKSNAARCSFYGGLHINSINFRGKLASRNITSGSFSLVFHQIQTTCKLNTKFEHTGLNASELNTGWKQGWNVQDCIAAPEQGSVTLPKAAWPLSLLEHVWHILHSNNWNAMLWCGRVEDKLAAHPQRSGSKAQRRQSMLRFRARVKHPSFCFQGSKHGRTKTQLIISLWTTTTHC